MPLPENLLFEADEFDGMNATRSPEKLSKRTLQSLVNGVIVGNQEGLSGGVIQTRPGKRAQLTTAISGKIVYQYEYTDPTGVKHLICATTDTTSTTGYLYDWVKDASTVTKLTALGVFNSYLVQMASLYTFAFIIGNVDGEMRQTDLVSVFQIAASPNPPTAALNPTTQAWLTDGNNVGSAWAADTLTSSPNVANGTFYYTGSVPAGGYSFSPNPNPLPDWYSGGPGMQFLAMNANEGSAQYITDQLSGLEIAANTTFAQFDDPPSYTITNAYIANAQKANTNNTFGGENGTGTGSTRYAQHFLFSALYVTDSGGATDSIYVTVYAYDSSHVQQSGLTQIFAPGVAKTVVTLRHMFCFDTIGETEIAYYKVQIGNPGIAARTGANGPYLTNVSCIPYVPPIAFTSSSGNAVTLSGLLPLVTFSVAGDDMILFWGGMRLSHTFAAPIDFTQYTTISIPFVENITPITNGLRARLNFKADAAHAGIMSDPLQVLTTTAGQLYLQTDVSSLVTTNGFGTNMNSIGVMELIFSADTDVVTGTSVADKALILSPLTFAGNLSIDLDYALRFTEATSNNPTTMLESGGSPISAEFVPNGLMASYKVTLPAPTNSSTTFFGIYREGGTFPDPYFRNETYLPVATGITTIANLTWNAGTGTYTGTSAITGYVDFTWNPTTRVYTSNIPDSDLQEAAFLFDHDATPTGATSICEYQNRLALAVGADLYISALTQGVSAGLYFNDAPDPANPNYLVQGNLIPVGAQEGSTLGQTIRRIVAYRGRAIIFFEQRTFVLQGLNNSNFAVYENAAMKDIGLLAPNAVSLIDNRLWFLAAQGVYNYDNVQLDRDLSYPIAALVSPGSMSFGTALNATAYAQASMITHAGRLILNVPGAGSSVISRTYVCDIENGGMWYQWNLGEVLSGETFSGSSDQDELIIGCGDGMIYSLGNGNFGDTTTVSGSPAAVTMTGTLARLTEPQYSLQALTVSGTADVLDATAAFTLTINGSPVNNNPVTASINMTLPIGDDVFIPAHAEGIRVPNYVRGRYLELAFSVTSVLPTTLRRMLLRYFRTFQN